MPDETHDAGTPTRIYRDAFRSLRGHPLDRVPCGTCVRCCRADFPVPLSPAEAERLPHMLDERTGRTVLARNGRDCAMFDVENNRCGIYETRPKSCRIYDCRQQWLAGMRNTERGVEINERVEQWRTQADTFVDLGVIYTVWTETRRWLAISRVPDVGPAVAYGMAQALCRSEPELRTIGRENEEKARALLATLNGAPTVAEFLE